MAYVNPVYNALKAYNFEQSGAVCFGTWKGYAASLRPYSGKNYYVDVAVRTEKQNAPIRKGVIRSLKEKKLKRLRFAGLTEKTASFMLVFGKAENYAADFAAGMDAAVAVLRENGLNPADTCAITGAPQPDSLCLARVGVGYSYQPVSSVAVRNMAGQAREKVEENQENGSYALGFVGALLGMLVGLIPNLLTIVLAERIYALLFALVPLCSMFGYKLFKGKMNKASMAIVIVLSLLGVLVMEYLEFVIYLVKDAGFYLAEAMATAAQFMVDPEMYAAAGGELLQMLLFMALGIWVAWRYMSSLTNGSAISAAQAQLDSLRPNPARQTFGEDMAE